jgi:hypothetical protein
MDATTRRMLKEAGLRTPDYSSCSEEGDSGIDEQLLNPSNQQAHYEATINHRLKKVLKHDSKKNSPGKEKPEESPLINFKEVFDKFGDHI